MRKLFLFIAAMLSLNLMANISDIDHVLYELNTNVTIGTVHNINIAEVVNPAHVWEEIKSTYDDDFVVPETVNDGTRDYIVMGIEAYAFYEADITTLELPAKMEQIEYKAFYGCSQLASIVCHRGGDVYEEGNYVPRFRTWNAETLNSNEITALDAFEGVNPNIPVYVPDEAVNLYKSSPWGDYFMNILPLSAKPQAIDQITNEQSPMSNKVLRDGQLLINRGDKTYTTDGRQVR